MQETSWKIKPTSDAEKVKKLSKAINVNVRIADMLVQRGIETYDQAKYYLRPSLDQLHDPFLIKDMDKAVERLEKAIKSDEQILIYGDYDVDGTTSVALLYKYLKGFTSKIKYYIPDRFKEGYGLSYQGIDFAANNSVGLMITIDCGIKAVDHVNYASEKGIDIIICDHHNPGEILPNAVAVLDPKQKDCHYPYKGLSGCGVGFKLISAYCQSIGDDMNTVFKYLDLVALSIAADIVPLTGENRVLAFFGLKQINKSPCLGIDSIKKVVGFEGKDMEINDLVFKISPRINAAGRMKTGMTAVNLLISENAHEAYEIVKEIEELNSDRKTFDFKTTEESLLMIEESEDMQKKYSIVLHHDDWNKGIIGIVASRLIEKYYKPTIVFTTSEGKLAGSARSVVGFNVYDAVESCSDLLLSFGGHRAAAGMTMKKENLEEFRNRFEKAVESNITEESLKPSIDIDLEIELEHITHKFVELVNYFGPFGPENLRPVYITRRVRDNGQIKQIGRDNEHLKLCIVNESNPNIAFDAIGFNMGEYYDILKNYTLFDVCYQLSENKFMNENRLQLIIKDIKVL